MPINIGMILLKKMEGGLGEFEFSVKMQSTNSYTVRPRAP